jgi:hypothetical protein
LDALGFGSRHALGVFAAGLLVIERHFAGRPHVPSQIAGKQSLASLGLRFLRSVQRLWLELDFGLGHGSTSVEILGKLWRGLDDFDAALLCE